MNKFDYLKNSYQKTNKQTKKKHTKMRVKSQNLGRDICTNEIGRRVVSGKIATSQHE